ncbi:MAG: beta-lactamase family protein [Alphaproteobacteria bacterium]|nr:beta-lactamase family protein [Alphaproteobacteria bacterium]MBU1512638.1 beta-lactamase family protein [Alphaproteobacteria bacterium]MBU2095032.1 beta-lactamase family protein [Alphaproteobacteria bacterium]MBU2151849.1 beta-lactamase family protein [Alphaproteobacteria bacterium]MBU2306248.1 beta-lactamase family protein [Alphaproteobacteria bacterium]
MHVARRGVLGLGLAAVAAGVAQAQDAELRIDTSGGPAAARFNSAVAEIAAYAARHVEAYGLPGLTLSLVGPDGFTALVRLGYADVDRRVRVGPDHLFQIGSITKSLTALAAHRLIDAGKLSLDDDAAKILPELPLPGPGFTIKRLLEHSTGLAHDVPLFPRGGNGRMWQGFPGGSQFSYSNTGYMIASACIARVSGRPFGEVLAETVLRPLSMTATKPLIVGADRALYAQGYGPFLGDRPPPRLGRLAATPWTDMTEGSGSVASTGADMARYLHWMIDAANGRGAPLLSDAGAKRWLDTVIDAPGWETGARYGGGVAHVQVGERTLLHHTGGMVSFSSAFHVDPQAGVGAFASSNVGGLNYRPRAITAYACQRLRAALTGGDAPKPAPAPAPLPPREALAGRYRSRAGETLTVEASRGGLTATLAGRRIALEPGGDDVFIATDPTQATVPLVFRRRGEAVQRAWWNSVEYLREGVSGYTPATPPELERLLGTYGNDDPWRGTFHVTAEGPALFVDGATPMTPLSGGGFRVGEDDWSPERMAFDAALDRRPSRAIYSGVDFLRRPT